jgi:LacI family transcriptional regulator
MVAQLDRVKGSHGVILKAQDEPEVAEAVNRLVASGVPVVTYTTDVGSSDRCAYVGIDNHGAGLTAAFLVNQWLGDAPSGVLITLSRTVFRGEGEREVGFRAGLRAAGRDIVEVSGSDGIDATNEHLVLDALARHPGVEAVYSPGGGNSATVRAFEALGRPCRVFVAHDLDVDNRRLLREGKLSVVLHNDLRADARLAMRAILAQHGALPEELVRSTPIQVVTPYNLPG